MQHKKQLIDAVSLTCGNKQLHYSCSLYHLVTLSNDIESYIKFYNFVVIISEIGVWYSESPKKSTKARKAFD